MNQTVFGTEILIFVESEALGIIPGSQYNNISIKNTQMAQYVC
jgi:hypothetical protein